MDAWADRVLDNRARVTEQLTDGELLDRAVMDMADSMICSDGWLIAPDDPGLRTHLEGEMGSTVLADAVIAKMRELGAARGRT